MPHMPYPRKFLNEGENVAVDLHPHWYHFAEPVAALVGSIVLGVIAISIGGTTGDALKWIALILIVISAIWLVKRYVSWATSHFVITDDRIIYKTGWISRHGVDIPLERVNNVIIHQGVFERIIGAGDLLIESAGESGQQRFTDIRRPVQVQNKIYDQINKNEERGGGAGSRVPIDAASQLEKLEGMLHRGTLTPEEFEAQKRRLLG